MKYPATSFLPTGKHSELEKRMIAQKRRQAGIAFPAPRKQDYLLIIRLDVKAVKENTLVSQGLKRLCTLFEQIDRNVVEFEDTSEDSINMYPLTRFNFTATIGFGKTFFRKLDIMKNCPNDLYDMGSYLELGDKSPYLLPQTDMILQLASNNYVVNKMVLQNNNYLTTDKGILSSTRNYLGTFNSRPLDIIESIKGWAKITDVHTGFHRADGRNLMGFYDGISNPHRLANNIWIDENEKGKETADGTYMVFQKIEHDLKEWSEMETEEQERWIGRSKATGLLLGTLSVAEEKSLISDLHSENSSIQRQASCRLSQLIDEQRSPTKNFFDSYDPRYSNIDKNCPISSHARMVNPRKTKDDKAIYRRGYLYVEDEFSEYPKSGLIFISFQNNIKKFEELKRNITQNVSSLYKTEVSSKLAYSNEKLATIKPFDTLTLGGGYYYIPPIIDKRISHIGQQFF